MISKKTTDIIIWGVAGVLLVSAVLVTVFGIRDGGTPFVKVVLAIIGVLLAALSVLVAMLYFITGGNGNYFLVSGNRIISPDNLTFEIVDARINAYIETLSAGGNKVNIEFLSENSGDYDKGPFVPLLAYKMVMLPAEKDKPEFWTAFARTTAESVRVLSSIIGGTGDTKLAAALVKMHAAGADALEDFIKGNKKYIQGRMLAYVKTNIAKFDDRL